MKKPSYVIRDGQAKATADYDALMKCIQEQKDVGDLG